MENQICDKNIYIIISQTGTLLSKIIKFVTKREYNHASITTRKDLHLIYSFGRKNPYNPFWGGFVTESKDFGTFKRFYKTKVIVLSLKVSDEIFCNINRTFKSMSEHRQDYKYNYLGLYLAAFNKCITHENRLYCSEFVGKILTDNNIEGADKLGEIVHPMSFLSLPNVKTVYAGRLQDYLSS